MSSLDNGAPKGPLQSHVDGLRELLDLMKPFRGNDQRARFLLTSTWMQVNGAAAAQRAADVAALKAGES
jgi:hypothetical protein